MKYAKFAVAAVAVAMTAGCASVMPSSTERTTDGVKWTSFADAERFTQSIVEGRSTLDDLAANGLDLRGADSQNAKRITPTVFIEQFGTNPTVMPSGARRCSLAIDRCTGYVFTKQELQKKGKGNIILRLTGFKKESDVTGWEAKLVVLLLDGVVVYKELGGTAMVSREESGTNPLGPAETGIFRLFK